MSAPPVVVKIGGSTLNHQDTSLKDLVALQKTGIPIVVVHGGGNVISQWTQKQGIPPQFVEGLRVTDAASLEIVVAVLTGLINKELVAQIHNLGGKAIGFSGIDGASIEAYIANPELGYVGEISNVDTEPIEAILKSGYIPMMAPLGFHRNDGSKHSGNPLYINGDTVAGEVARALSAEQLIFLTDVPGIMDTNGRVVRRLDPRRAQNLIRSGIIRGGMIPKLDACLRALETSSYADIIDGREPEALLDCIQGRSIGTRISASNSQRK